MNILVVAADRDIQNCRSILSQPEFTEICFCAITVRKNRHRQVYCLAENSEIWKRKISISDDYIGYTVASRGRRIFFTIRNHRKLFP